MSAAIFFDLSAYPRICLPDTGPGCLPDRIPAAWFQCLHRQQGSPLAEVFSAHAVTDRGQKHFCPAAECMFAFTDGHILPDLSAEIIVVFVVASHMPSVGHCRRTDLEFQGAHLTRRIWEFAGVRDFSHGLRLFDSLPGLLMEAFRDWSASRRVLAEVSILLA